jgi:hypothetical protein
MPRLAKAQRASRLVRDCVVPAFVASAFALFAPTAWTLFFTSGSYVGVQDESVSSAAAERYRPYLLTVLGSMGIVAFTELVFLFVALLGLSLLWHLEGRRIASARGNWILHLFAAGIVTATYFLFVADRHPGLFLSTLSHSTLAYPLLAVARWVAPLIAFLSLLGYAFGLAKGPTRLRAGIAAALVVVVAGLVVRRQIGRAHV